MKASCAVQKYEQCVAALHDELNVEPAQQTVKLCEQIRSLPAPAAPGEPRGATIAPAETSMHRLKQPNAISRHVQ